MSFKPEKVTQTINDLIAKLKEEGFSEFAAVGYCFGVSIALFPNTNPASTTTSLMLFSP